MNEKKRIITPYEFNKRIGFVRPLEKIQKAKDPTFREARFYGAVGENEKSYHIEARDVPDAWFQAVDLVYQHGNIQPVTGGSFETVHNRKQIFNISGIIHFPAIRPLEPDIPSGLISILPPPVAKGYLDQYIFKLRYADSKEENEDYTYSQFIEPLYEKVIDRLISDGFGTNQMYIPVGDTASFDLRDPPCLRGIDIKVVNQKLHFTVYFRSWDLWNGFPANLGGLQMLKEMMVGDLQNKGMTIHDGKLMFSSSGLHLYDYAWPLAKMRLGK